MRQNSKDRGHPKSKALDHPDRPSEHSTSDGIHSADLSDSWRREVAVPFRKEALSCALPAARTEATSCLHACTPFSEVSTSTSNPILDLWCCGNLDAASAQPRTCSFMLAMVLQRLQAKLNASLQVAAFFRRLPG